LKVTISPSGTLQNGSQRSSLILSGVVPEAPVITTFGFTQNPTNLNEYGITFTSDPGGFYTLESSATLSGGSWTALDTVQTENSSTTVLTSRNPAESKRFWRIGRGHP
jgi:hypothetical protein